MSWKTMGCFGLWELGFNQGGKVSFTCLVYRMRGVQSWNWNSCRGMSLAVTIEHKLEYRLHVYVNLQKVKEKMSF